MRRALGAAAAAVITCAAVPSHAASRGTIEGRVVNQTTGRPQAGVRVVLTTAGSDVDPLEKEVTTDSDGRYAFHELATGEDRFYVLDAHYGGALFPGRPVSLPDDTARPPVITSTMKVWETTSDPASVLVTRDDLFVVPGDGRAAVVESVTIVNQTERAYVGRGRAMGAERQDAPTFGFALPAEADLGSLQIVDATIDIPRLVATDFGFGVTVAIPPGETRITFSYSLDGVVGTYDVSRTALYPIAEMSIYAADPLVVNSETLVPSGQVTLRGQRYGRWSAREAFDAGDAIQAVTVAEAALQPLLLIGAGLAIVVIAGVAFALVRRRRHPPLGDEPAMDPPARDELLVAIADLDLRYEKGELPEPDWREQRAELKRRLSEMRVPEPAP